MALVKVTAFKWVVVQDPEPIEGNQTTVQMQPGQYKAFQMYDHQADRMWDRLKRAKAAGMLDFEIEFDDCCTSINTKRVAVISFNDVLIGHPILLGPIDSGNVVEETCVKITEAFDGGTEISVGDSDVNARLMKKDCNKPSIIGQYKIDNDYLYTADNNLYVYFPAGTPTQGAAEIFVYLA
jgi:hypothetical protein